MRQAPSLCAFPPASDIATSWRRRCYAHLASFPYDCARCSARRPASSSMIQRYPFDPIVTRDNPSSITLDITPHNLLGPFLPFPNHVGDHTISYETSLAKSA
jgi:hypothetical protein